jgi:D-alanine-D-alanine ligase-like ATP-grasp enzyme
LLERAVTWGFLNGFRAAGILKPSAIDEHTHIHQRTRVVADEAARRGMEVKVYTIGNAATNFFLLKGHGEKPLLFEGLPGIDPTKTKTTIDDKELVRGVMQEIGAPTPEGASFYSREKALAYGASIGWPLVVKPRFGSLSAHTTVNIQDAEELDRAIRVAQQISLPFIVERYIPGHLYRATTVGEKVVAIGRRDPPSIVGDGISTIEELILRREQEQVPLMVALGYKPEEIPSLPRHHMKMDPSEVLPAGEKVAVTWKINLSYGATVEDVTDLVHPDNIELFETIARRVKHPTVGIDFIAPSIADSWKSQPCAIIELNSLPSIDLHHAPIVIGQERNVAGALLDYIVGGKIQPPDHS